MERGAKYILGGLGALAAAGAAFFYLRETRSEEPEHAVLTRKGRFELRSYPALLIAETVQTGARERATNRGFLKLASYIFAEEREGDPIKMTAPVLLEPTTDGLAGWKVRFIMPAEWTAETLPAPGPDVGINDIPARTVAAIRFSGYADDAKLAEKEAELRRWIDESGFKVRGDAEYALYNSPVIPGPLRRTEVLIEVEAP